MELKRFRLRLLVLAGLLGLAMAIFIPIRRSQLAAEAEGLVRQLSWDSVGGNCIGGHLVIFPEGSPARRLVEIGTPASRALARALKDPDRGVAAHLILTRIYHPERNGVSTEYLDDKQTRNALGGPGLLGCTHTVNTLRWQWHANTDRQTVEPTALEQISEQWQAELSFPADS